MATSGSVNHTVDADDLIRDALNDIGALEEGEPITGEHTQKAKRALNNLLKWLNAHGLHLWTKREGILFLDGVKRSYTLPTDNCAADEFGYTTLSADEASGQTVLSVTATAPGGGLPAMAASDIIGIELDDGSRQWTTISSVDSATQVTVAAALTEDAGSGATVYWYTSNINKPVRVLSARRGLYNGAEVPCDVVTRDEYFDQPSKDATGQPTMAHYQPKVSTGEMFVWPKGSVTTVLRFTYERLIEDVDDTSDNFDLPPEWYQPLQDMLAARLASAYQLPIQERAYFDARSERGEMKILEFDNETGGLHFEIELSR